MILVNNPLTCGRDDSTPPVLTPALWQHVKDTLQLSPQQARIVGLILAGKQDKAIAAEMHLTRDTVRTYLRRIFDRLGVDDRVGLILCVFELCLDHVQAGGCPTLV